MNRAKIIGLCTLASCGYGIVHDQITVRVCEEYLSVAHRPLFPTGSPTLLALCWGVAAAWWVGLALGVALAFVAGAGPSEPLPVRTFYQPLGVLLVAMGTTAFTAAMVSYELTQSGFLPVPTSVEEMVPAGKEARFMAVWAAHSASYLVGVTGGMWVCFRTWQARGKPAGLPLLPRSRAAWLRPLVIVGVGAAVWWWLHRAR